MINKSFFFTFTPEKNFTYSIFPFLNRILKLQKTKNNYKKFFLATCGLLCVVYYDTLSSKKLRKENIFFSRLRMTNLPWKQISTAPAPIDHP